MVLSEPLSTKLGPVSNGDIGDKQHMEDRTSSPSRKKAEDHYGERGLPRSGSSPDLQSPSLSLCPGHQIETNTSRQIWHT